MGIILQQRYGTHGMEVPDSHRPQNLRYDIIIVGSPQDVCRLEVYYFVMHEHSRPLITGLK